MSYFLLFTYNRKVAPKKLLSIGICPHCGHYTERYLSRASFRLGLFYIPLIFIPIGHYINCSSCEFGKKISLEEYRNLKKENPDMPGVGYMHRAFQQICELVDATVPEERTVENIYSLLATKLRIEKGERHIRQIIADYLAYLETISAARTATAATAAIDTDCAADTAETSSADEVLVEEFPNGQLPVTPVGVVPPVTASDSPSVFREAPVVFSAPEGSKSDKGHSPLQRLWLLAALPMTLIALFLIAVCALTSFEPIYSSGLDLFSEILARVIVSLIFTGIPTGLSVLFYWLAFRKKKIK